MGEHLLFLEFDTLTVIGTGKGSEIYMRKQVQGHKISKSSDILVGDLPFSIDYILSINNNQYRLINSNATIIVEKT